MESKNTTPLNTDNEKIIENKELNIWEALIPIFALVGMLAFNVFVFGDEALAGSNQFILLLGAAVAAIVGFYNKVSYKQMMEEVAKNVKSTTGALLILLMVGALAGTWLISGIIPAMIYYGLQILNPTIFLGACVIICAVISIATGSSWTTSATVGIALIGIGEALGVSLGMTAGAVLSGAYFGDKMSPLSDTTNLAPAMAGGDLFSHIKYMAYTTIPTILITFLVFIIIGFNLDTTGAAKTEQMVTDIKNVFNISPWLFAVPLAVVLLILKKTPPLVALLAGSLLGAVFCLIFQSSIIWQNGLRYKISNIPDDYSELVEWNKEYDKPTNNNYQSPGTYFLKIKQEDMFLEKEIKFVLPNSKKEVTTSLKQSVIIKKGDKMVANFIIEAIPTGFLKSAYFTIMNALTVETSVNTDNEDLKDLFTSKGMNGMLGTIWLIVCAMVFGGIMDAIGALSRISAYLLSLASSVFGLFASTVVSCLALNLTASDQYLAIVVPGKMFSKAFKDKGLAPENLSRTLEDSGTVTSVLVPWNTCGAYQSGVLGVPVVDYFFYAIFNWLSPFMTLLFAAFRIKIKELKNA